jgi:hypothetical protein
LCPCAERRGARGLPPLRLTPLAECGIGYQAQDGTIAAPNQLDTSSIRAESEWAASVAVMHVASGLFA